MTERVHDADTGRPHPARIWSYWLGGEHLPVDRAAGDEWAARHPEIIWIVRESRAFLRRTVRFLAGPAGVRQFLDIGSGLPTGGNTHELVGELAPGSRVVYVDHDPVVVEHAQALLAGADEEVVRYLDADLHDPSTLYKRVTETLDPAQPMAVLLMGALGHIADHDDARDLVRYLMDRTCPGSYLVIADGTHVDEAAERLAAQQYERSGAVPYHPRDPQEIESFFEGLDWVQPGFGPISRWRPDGPPAGPAVPSVGGVGRRT